MLRQEASCLLKIQILSQEQRSLYPSELAAALGAPWRWGEMVTCARADAYIPALLFKYDSRADHEKIAAESSLKSRLTSATGVT